MICTKRFGELFDQSHLSTNSGVKSSMIQHINIQHMSVIVGQVAESIGQFCKSDQKDLPKMNLWIDYDCESECTVSGTLGQCVYLRMFSQIRSSLVY